MCASGDDITLHVKSDARGNYTTRNFSFSSRLRKGDRVRLLAIARQIPPSLQGVAIQVLKKMNSGDLDGARRLVEDLRQGRLYPKA